MDNFFTLGHHRLHVGYVYFLAAFLAVSPASAQWTSSDSATLSNIHDITDYIGTILDGWDVTWWNKLQSLQALLYEVTLANRLETNQLAQANQSLESLVASGAITTNQLNRINQYLESISASSADASTYVESIDEAIWDINGYIQSDVLPFLMSADQYLQSLAADSMYMRADADSMVMQGSQVLQDLVFIESGIDGVISAINNLELNCDCSAGYTIISNWYGSWFGWFGEDGRFELIIDATLEIIDKLGELANLSDYLTQISGQIDDLQNAILAEMRLEFRWWTNTVYSVMTDLIPSGFDARGVFDTSQASFVNYQDFVDTSQAVTNFEFSEQTWNSNFFFSANSALATEGNQSVWLSRLTDVNSSRLNDLALDGLDAFEANFEQGGDIYIDAFSILGHSSSNIQIPLSIITENNDIKTFFSNTWRFIVLCCKLGVSVALSFKVTRMVAGEWKNNPLGV